MCFFVIFITVYLKKLGLLRLATGTMLQKKMNFAQTNDQKQ